MSDTVTPALLADVTQPSALLRTLLDISLTGILLLRPLYAEADEAAEAAPIVDFAYVHLNPAAQQMLQLPECPAESFLTLFPTAQAAGVFGFYREAFYSGRVERHQQNYQADGLDGYYVLVAQRQEELLAVSFTDTNDQPRSAVEEALRASQARERAALAEAERQQALLYRVFEQAPAMICILQGPAHVFEFANAPYRALMGGRPLVGRPFAEALPELAGQGILEPLNEVYRTGESFFASEQPTRIDHDNTSPPELEQRYYNLVWQARRDLTGTVDGVLVFAFDVTPQVLARQQVEHFNQVAETARAAAEAGRQRLMQMLRRMPANIALLRGPTHIYDFVNPAYERLFPARSPLGRPMREVIPELESQGFYERFDRVYATGEPYYEAEAEAWADYAGTGEPQRRYYRIAFEPLHDAQGQVTEILNFAVDVTEQVEARQQVEHLNQELAVAQATTERERAQLQALLEQAPVAIALFQGEEIRVVSANERMAALWGRTPALVVGHTLLEAMPELQGQGFDDMIRQVLATGVPYVGTEAPATLLKDGQLAVRYYNFSCQAIYDAQGEQLGVLNVSTEVTEQLEARRQLQQLNEELEARVQARTQEAHMARRLAEVQQQRLEQLFLQAPAAICILDGPDLVYELVNSTYQQLFPGRALYGLPLLEALPELTDQPVWHTLQQVYRTGATHLELGVPVPLARYEGGPLEDVYFNYIFQPRYTAEGQVDGLVVFAFEVTEQVRARQQVQSLNEELAAINEELTATNEELNTTNTQLTRTNVDLDTFVYTASHDLKAPITNIESIALALRSALPAAVQQEELVAHLLDLLGQTVTRFQFTIGQLTDLSKLQLAHAGPAEPVNVAAVVESVRLDLAPTIVADEVQLTVEVAPDLLVSFSPANLRSAVYNLLSNAVKYRALDRPAQVRVRAFPAGGRVTLEVQDNGLGLNAHQQQRLFGLFQRLHTHVEGTGVGLYITKRLVENGGGTIAVQSQVDVGTTFTVTLPT